MDYPPRLFVACRRHIALVACLGALAGAGVGLTGCHSADAVLLTVTGDQAAQQYDLYVRDDATSQVIFHSGFNPVQAPGEAPRDLTKDKLKIALKLAQGGKYTLLLVGVIGDLDGGKPALSAVQLFWAGHVHVDGTVSISAKLLTVPAGDDHDRDLWPDVNAFQMHVPEAAQRYGQFPDLLDCDDNPDTDPKAADINPFAAEICNDNIDEDCNGSGDEACVDQDGDHDFKGDDCDDSDPKRHHATDIDPFPDPPNCCGYNLGKAPGSPDEHKDFTGDPLLCPMQRCGDGIDESCRGGLTNDPANDTKCVVDADCDGYPAPPLGNDCDDKDPSVHPGAPEICGNGKDDNCNGIVDDGCVPCDLDGDGYERTDAANGCPDANDKHPGMIDCNDYDSGVFPGQTTTLGGSEGGMTTIGRLTASLRGDCRKLYEDTGTTGTTKIAPFAGFLAGDADCNGTAYEGCPETIKAGCDVDGDGWPNSGAGCNPSGGAIDCNDNDPTIYPGAPDKCGDGIAQNCTADVACGGNDKDGDGYVAGVDCDDTNAAIHPWAAEVCNGVDDDCDGLIDEGNPDPNGVPLVTAGVVTSCTDSDVGECAKTKGSCVCSISQEPTYTDPQGRRVFCPGEQAGGQKPPKCFGAGQPKPQSCNATAPLDDDCDGRVDAPDGVNLAMKGMPCGNNIGQCKQGTIVACDQTKTNAYVQFGLLPPADAWWVCSSDTVYPQAEQCNGFDDDCDGLRGQGPAAGEPDERDLDNDKYMACTGCSGTLGAGMLGCSDCNDGNLNIHPGAPEMCNNIDDDCNPATADGSGECGQGANLSRPTCCSTQSSCRDLTTDPLNCGMCGNACIESGPAANANGCGGSNCLCGASPACSGGSWCNSGSCNACNTKNHCGPSCVDCGTSVCNGTACTACNVDADCATSTPATCSGGNCYCSGGACLVKKSKGKSCTAPNQCASGNCVDNGGGSSTCCTSASCGGCNTCTSGDCLPAGPGTDPHNVCNAGPCESNNCDGSGTCNLPNGTGCGTPSCSGSTLTVSACMSGACMVGGGMACPGNFACSSGSACATSCSSDAQCATNYYCNAGTCLATKPPGSGCGAGSDCTSGFCVGSVCCGSACSGYPSTCSGTTETDYTCATGTCKSMTKSCNGYTCGATTCNSACSCSGAPPCVDAVHCAATDFCNGTMCVSAAGNGSPCTLDAQCTSGFCVSGTCCNNACNGGIATCSGTTSVIPNTCGTGTCASTAVACTPGDYCTAGSCTACTVNSACGASCNNCTSGNFADGNICVNNVGTYACGCSSFATDCNATVSDGCGMLAGKTVCTCGGAAACTGGKACVKQGMSFVCQ